MDSGSQPGVILPKLVGLSGPMRGQVLLLNTSAISIGRDSSNDLWCIDPALSRKHCLVEQNAGNFMIRDLDSRNGTLVNGSPVRERELRHRDQVSLGDSILIFLLRDEGIPAASTPVEMTATADLTTAPIVLHPEDAIYLQPDLVLASLPESARVARDLNVLLKIATSIGHIRERESLEWQLLGMLFDVVPADRAAILRFMNGPENFDSAVAWDRVQGPEATVRVSRTIVRRVIEDRAGLLVTDVQSDPGLRDVESLTKLRVQSVLCVPLIINGDVQGVIYLDTRNRNHCFDQNHLQVMAGVASLASLALENVGLWEGLREENQRLRSEINVEHDMVGSSPRLREIIEIIQRVAPTTSTVLIQGESGTGKELVARAIHRTSPRAESPFVAINCAALTESLLESELFGHEKGAFTGAIGQKKGRIEIASGGTLFLDEIGELALGMQAKLLRVLQEREFERLGGSRPIKVDIRLIAATNRDLQQSVAQGTFRPDLYYRLNVVSLTTPPLRDRRDDIPLLADSFLEKFSGKCNIRKKSLSPEALSALQQYDWPGNVRELENAMERAVVLGPEQVVFVEDLPEAILEAASPAASQGAKYLGGVKESKKQLVVQALEQANGYYIDAAKILGIHPNSLLRLIRNLGLKTSGKGTISPPAAD
jgi:transcriptional regulator with GAF, ATPase, and Fis domain